MIHDSGKKLMPNCILDWIADQYHYQLVLTTSTYNYDSSKYNLCSVPIGPSLILPLDTGSVLQYTMQDFVLHDCSNIHVLCIGALLSVTTVLTMQILIISSPNFPAIFLPEFPFITCDIIPTGTPVVICNIIPICKIIPALLLTDF